VTVSDIPRRQIYHQGFWDGACFLYAIANAYKALTGNKVEREKWDRGVRYVPRPLDLLSGVGATSLSYDEAVALVEGMLGTFSEPDESFEVVQLDNQATTAGIADQIAADSVVLFAFGGPTEVHEPENHIVCGVASDANALHLSCSAAFSSRHLRDGDYVETYHPSVGRYSNDVIAIGGPVRVAPRWRWRVVLTRSAPMD
jgi:hypothetical protein